MELPPKDGRKADIEGKNREMAKLQWSYRPKTVERPQPANPAISRPAYCVFERPEIESFEPAGEHKLQKASRISSPVAKPHASAPGSLNTTPPLVIKS